MKLLRTASVLIVATFACACAAGFASSSRAAAAETFDVPIDYVAFTPCSAPDGEDIHLVGRVHVVVNGGVDATGTSHQKVGETYQNVSGVGLTTGAVYRAVGSYSSVVEGDGAPGFAASFVSAFQLVTSGGGNDLRILVTTHTIVDANGNLRVDIAEANIVCS